MSAYKRYECSLEDKECLLKALKALGLNHREYESAVKLRGYLGDQRKDEAEIIVPREELNQAFTGASNDLGFKWNGKSYEMIVSDYDMHQKVHERVAQAYAKAVMEKALALNQFTLTSHTSNDDLKSRKQVKVKLVAKKVI